MDWSRNWIGAEQQDANDRAKGIKYIGDLIVNDILACYSFDVSSEMFRYLPNILLGQAATSWSGNVDRNIPQRAQPRKKPKTSTKKATTKTKCTAAAKVRENSTASVKTNSLAANKLCAIDRAEQKRILGERLFPSIKALCPQYADKITGMVVELDNTDILDMLEHPKTLKKQVSAAFAVLQAYYKART